MGSQTANFLKLRAPTRVCYSCGAMGKPQQYMDVLKRTWQRVSAEWGAVGPKLAGPVGYRAVHVHSVKLAHPPLPVFMYLLSCTLLASNAPRVYLWGSFVPLCLWVLNVNYSQTRKSGLTTLAYKVAALVDKRMREDLAKIVTAKREQSMKTTTGTPQDGPDQASETLPPDAPQDAPEPASETLPGLFNMGVHGAVELLFDEFWQFLTLHVCSGWLVSSFAT